MIVSPHIFRQKILIPRTDIGYGIQRSAAADDLFRLAVSALGGVLIPMLVRGLIVALLACTLTSIAGAGEKNIVKEKVDKLAAQIKKPFKKKGDKGHTWRIAIISFDNVSAQAKKQDIGRGIAELLTTNLVQSGLFTVIERAQLEKILKEQRLSLTGLIAPESARQVGRLLGAEAILCGTVSELGDFYNINARVIDVETAVILTTALIDIKRDDLTRELKGYTIVVEARSPVSAMLYSALLPGLGQWYNGQPIKALTIGILAAGTLGGALVYLDEGNTHYDEYEWARTNREARELYDAAQSQYDTSINFQYAFLGIYLYGIIDAYRSGKKMRTTILRGQRDASVEFKLARDSRGRMRPVLVYSRRF